MHPESYAGLLISVENFGFVSKPGKGFINKPAAAEAVRGAVENGTYKRVEEWVSCAKVLKGK